MIRESLHDATIFRKAYVKVKKCLPIDYRLDRGEPKGLDGPFKKKFVLKFALFVL